MPIDHHRRKALALALLAACAGRAWAQAGPAPLRLGIAPYASTRVILQVYQPLRLHLERALGQPVDVITAPDFDEFGRRAAAQQYDIVMSTGPLARYLQVDAGYLPLVRYRADIKAQVIVAGDGRVRSAADLSGRRVITLGATSTTGIWGMSWLKAKNVQRVDVKHVAASDSIAQLILAGDADAGLISDVNMLGLSPAVRAQLRVLDESPPLLGRVYMVSARLTTQAARVEAALLSFARTDDGRAHLETFKPEGFRQVEPADMKALDPLVGVIRHELATTRDPQIEAVRRDIAPRTAP